MAAMLSRRRSGIRIRVRRRAGVVHRRGCPWRGRGMGRALLRAVAGRARSAGIGQISLSVGRQNHAHGLYLAEGYKIVDFSDANSDTMIKEL